VAVKNSLFGDITLCSPVKITDLSEEHITSSFRIEKEGNQESSMKQTANRGDV
jgi:hypothetical protein